MPLSIDTLAAGLASIENATTEPPVLDGWEIAWQEYFLESVVKGINPVDIDVFAPATAALKAGLTGISAPQPAPLPGATKIVDAIKLFWLALTPIVASVWVVAPPLASLVTPPPWMLSTDLENVYKISLAAVFTANVAAAAAQVPATKAVATMIHANNLGATVLDTTAPTPLVLPIT